MNKKITILTEQQIKFVDEYIKTNDVYEAARAVGVKDHKLDEVALTWPKHPTILAMLEHKRLAVASLEKVEAGWIIAELKDLYKSAKDDGDNVNALKALDMLGKHVGLYAADKNPTDKPVTVVITNYAGVKIENGNDGKEIN